MVIECCRMVIECCYSGYGRACVTMFNEAFVIAVVCIEHDIVVIHHCALFIYSYVIRRGEVGEGGGVEEGGGGGATSGNVGTPPYPLLPIQTYFQNSSCIPLLIL